MSNQEIFRQVVANRAAPRPPGSDEHTITSLPILISDLPMPSPLAKLMTYGGTPINRQADRFLSYKSRKRHGRKKRGTPAIQADSLKRVCPICGKRKLGLEAHMAAIRMILHCLAQFGCAPIGQARFGQLEPMRIGTSQPFFA